MEENKTASNEALFKSFGIAFVKHDLEKVALCLTDNFEWSLPTGEVFSGKERALAAMAERFADSGGPEFSDSTFEFYGDTIVQTYRVRAVDSHGDRVDRFGCDVYRVKDGLIDKKDAYWKQVG